MPPPPVPPPDVPSFLSRARGVDDFEGSLRIDADCLSLANFLVLFVDSLDDGLFFFFESPTIPFSMSLFLFFFSFFGFFIFLLFGFFFGAWYPVFFRRHSNDTLINRATRRISKSTAPRNISPRTREEPFEPAHGDGLLRMTIFVSPPVQEHGKKNNKC